ncbi:hypothetical protein [Acuticoccus mangrovi]|uniref:C-type lysozyme inhibitor domain-containing protein n=1 Tax=Acuticoccus mangrovi TaxID=2796142 RepID=A0A934MK65_9HYPH|nr:hypothetical protein [Acuticoccus mangrovi]MBJ3775199.1 hypothetical protein [Acuticoccus mangrovi]
MKQSATARRLAGGALLGCAVAALAGCADKIDLRDDVFVGDWNCAGKDLKLTTRTITADGITENIAWIEMAKNADYGLFTTKGAHYSVFDTQRNSITWHAHGSGETLACTRVK